MAVNDTMHDRREELVEAALSIVRESGFGGLTMKRVAEKVGFSEAAAYRYFESKEELQTAMAMWVGKGLLDIARREATREDLPKRERLKAIVQKSLEFTQAHDGVQIQLLAEVSSEGEGPRAEIARSIVNEYVEIAGGLIDGYTFDDETVKPANTILATISLITGFALWRKVIGETDLVRSMNEELPEHLTVFLLEASKLQHRNR